MGNGEISSWIITVGSLGSPRASVFTGGRGLNFLLFFSPIPVDELPSSLESDRLYDDDDEVDDLLLCAWYGRGGTGGMISKEASEDFDFLAADNILESRDDELLVRVFADLGRSGSEGVSLSLLLASLLYDCR